MLTLALDTTTGSGSCAVVRDEVTLVEQEGDSRLPQASRLPGALQAALAAASSSLADVDVFAVATGPGSFTGLRVGIATMQGLAFATGRPLVGVSVFDALASLAPADAKGGPLAVWIDAWRGEIYTTVYIGAVQQEAPAVERPEDALARLGPRAWFIGDGVRPHLDLVRASLGPGARVADPVAPPVAAAIGRAAARMVANGHRPAPDAIEPVYVRRPTAIIVRDARRRR
jgi:tRNA threonylcarbamoyladenosine biosynthesis protein TsaB